MTFARDGGSSHAPPSRTMIQRSARPGAGHLSVLAVLGLLTLGGLSHEGRRALDNELAAGVFRATPAGIVRAIRAYLTNDDDMYRCHAYASAILGRPYRSYFVRTRAGWDATFARGLQENPDATPLAQPGAALRPYRDFLLEYPPGFLLVLLPPALAASTVDGYALAFKLEMAICLLVVLLTALGLARALAIDENVRARLPGAFAAAVLGLGVVCTHRYDAFVAACMGLAVLAAAKGRARTAGGWLGVAIVSKGVPLLLLPLLAAYLAVQFGRAAAVRLLTVTAALSVTVGLATWCWCGSGFVEALVYHRDRPVQIESTWGALLSVRAWFLGPGSITVVHSYSSRNLRGPAVEAIGALAGASVAGSIVALTVWLVLRLRAGRSRRARLEVVVDGAVALLAAYMTLGKVFCPQYLVWILPFALVAARGRGRSVNRPRVLMAILVATQIIYPLGYPAVKALRPWACAFVLARDLALIAWALSLVREGTNARDDSPALAPSLPKARQPPTSRSLDGKRSDSHPHDALRSLVSVGRSTVTDRGPRRAPRWWS